MANTTVSIRERIKDSEGRWRWTRKISIPERDLKPSEAQRRGKFYLVWTEAGRKREQRIKTTLTSTTNIDTDPPSTPLAGLARGSM